MAVADSDLVASILRSRFHQVITPHCIQRLTCATAGTTEPITSGAQAKKIKGIGQSAADRVSSWLLDLEPIIPQIDEFISGGVGRQFYENNEKAQIVAQFKDIHGVGTNFANELYRLGARTIQDLRTHDYGLTTGQMVCHLQRYQPLDQELTLKSDRCRLVRRSPIPHPPP